MGAAQFNLKPADITRNLEVLSNLTEKQKLCSDSEGKLAVDDRLIFVSFRRKYSGLDVAAIEVTFQKAIEFLRQEGSDEVSLKNTIIEIKDKLNDAVTVGLVRQFKIYLHEKNEVAKRFARLILSTLEQYDKLNPSYPIILNKKVKEQLEDLLLEESLKKAVIPVAPPPPRKKEKKSAVEETQKNVVIAAVGITLSSRPTPGFVMLNGQVSLRSLGQRILAERQKKSQMHHFDQSLIEKVQEKEQEEGKPIRRKRGKAPIEKPVDTFLVDKLAQIRLRVEPAVQDA